MVYKEHLIEIWVNGQKLELENQKSINIRFNNVLFDPTKITSTQAEYSFEFEVPATPRNNTIFDYANNLGKLNKFHQRYQAVVYADGSPIFNGTLVVNGFNNKQYSLNLVSVKVLSLQDIFGDMTMNEIKWKVPFEGAGNGDYTMDWYNGQLAPEVCFPLVSYGAFQKAPYMSDDVGTEFTSKFDFDKWNRWDIESFYPSANMLLTLKKAFESVKDDKGDQKYIVGGDVFTNQDLTEIFMSTNLADGQSPDYNLGNTKFGKLSLSVSWTSNDSGYTQDLTFPYYEISGYWDLASGEAQEVSPEYNLTAVQIFDMLHDGNVTVNGTTNMYKANEKYIVIPADGFYKIDITQSSSLLTSSALTAVQWVREWNDNIGTLDLRHEEKEISFQPTFAFTTPLEIQLVRNYDDNLELIKGQFNCKITDGYPDHATEGDRGRTINYASNYTCFPHEKMGVMAVWFGYNTKADDLIEANKGNFMVLDSSFGYMPKVGECMAFDPAVSPTFICGWTTMGNLQGSGTSAVMKNGYSWSKTFTEKQYAFYQNSGYRKCDLQTGAIDYTWTNTDYQKNAYNGAPYPTFNLGNTTMNGEIHCCVYLKKNDKIQLFAVHRDYENENGNKVTYRTSSNVNLTIQAMSPDTYENLIRKGFSYTSTTEFDTDLNIGNFMNKEKKVSEWVQQISDAFNLEITQYANTISINTKKKLANNVWGAVDIDDRSSGDNAESKMIDYPRSMAVKYKIDLDEWGAERSAVEAAGSESILNTDEWKKYVDSGYTNIILNDDTYETSTSDKNLQFSYTWYDTFHWYAVNQSGTQTSDTPVDIKIPVISKYTYMIDGYDYQESRKHDGYGLSQRFWFRPSNSGCYVWTDTSPAQRVSLYLPSNLLTNYRDKYFNLSYKNTENSILTEYFNINAFLASNYVELDVYLSADEYNRIKNGSLVHFDSDLYYPVEVQGYDPSGSNPTTIKLMKKVS